MDAALPAAWLERVAESLCAHEERRDTLLNFPPRYEVLEELSRGGMGIVYRAWDPQLGRNVALKVLRAEDGGAAEAHERFQREARLAASLHHPNIVPIYDTGTWNGQDYIAMQLLDGQTLAHVKLDRRTALACVRDAARALQFAHDQGIVHRDIKPSNLMRDASGRVYVADFGVARQSVATASMTTPGTVVGTPAYMSPEQAMGLPADARSDVYSLGATLYELLTGKPPFDGEPLAVIEAVRTREPETARRMVPNLSKNVDAILTGAMERRPEDRYPSAAALADDIDGYLAGERPTRRPRGLSYKVQREFVRHPWRSGGAILLCLLLLMAGVVIGYFIRSYVHLRLGYSGKDLPTKKKDFKIGALFFPSEAEREIALIESEEKRIEDAKSTLVAREKERKAREERDRLAALARNLERQKDDAEREKNISELYSAVLKAVTDGSLEGVTALMDSLRKVAPTKYEELLPRVRTAEFAHGIRQLGSFATKAEVEAFSRTYASLSSDDYTQIDGRKSSLLPPVISMAQSLVAKNNAREALDWWNEAERLGGVDASFHEQRGLTLLKLEKFDLAEKDFEKFLQSSPANITPPASFAVLPYRKGHEALLRQDFPQAMKFLTESLRIDGNQAMAYHDRGLARFLSSRQATEALTQDLRHALNLDPSLKPDPRYREVAIAYSRAEGSERWKEEDPARRREASQATLAWLDDIAKRVGDNDELRIERAILHRRLRNYDSALELLAGTKASPEVVRMQGILRFVQALRQNRDTTLLRAALADFDRTLTLEPQGALSLYWRGAARELLGDSRGAKEDLELALHLGLRLADLHLRLSRVHYDEKRYETAIEQAGIALGLSGTLTEEEYISNLYEDRELSRNAGTRLLDRDGFYARALPEYLRTDFAASEADSGRAIALDNHFFKGLILRGDSKLQLKETRAAREDYEQAFAAAHSKVEQDTASKRKEQCDPR